MLRQQQNDNPEFNQINKPLTFVWTPSTSTVQVKLIVVIPHTWFEKTISPTSPVNVVLAGFGFTLTLAIKVAIGIQHVFTILPV